MTTLIAPRPAVKTTPEPTTAELMADAARTIADVDAFLAARRPAALEWPESDDLDGFTWEIGPDAADDQWHADQSTNHHFDGPTPDEVLDGPEPDWDAMADESAALDRLCAGGLL